MTRSYGPFIEGSGDAVAALLAEGKIFVLDADELEAELVAAGVGYVRIAATLREPGPRNGMPGALFVRRAVEGNLDARTTR